MQETHEKFLSLWNELAADDGIARLSRLDLRAILPLLPWVTILEMSDENELLFRLGGTGIEGEIGCGMRGKKIADLCKDRKTAEIAEAFIREAMKSRTGLYLNGHFSSPVHAGQQFCGLGLPFLDDKSLSRKDRFIFFQVWKPFERRNRDFTNLWGKIELTIEEMFEVHVGEAIDSKAVPADILRHMRRLGITTGRMPALRLVSAVAD